METEGFVAKIGGPAGEGIMTAGLLLSKTCARHGLYIFDYTEYPSLITGGLNTYQVTASKNPVFSQTGKTDLIVALNKFAFESLKTELNENTVIIYDHEDDNINVDPILSQKAINLPMVRLAKEMGAKPLMGNNVGLGASVYLLGLDLEILNQVIADVFKDKGEEVIAENQNAAKAGYDYMKTQREPLQKVEKHPADFLTVAGNEAIGLGALAGGLKFYAAYPMTPSSSLLHFLAGSAKKTSIVVKHAEDEISVINMALGASFAGARSMIGTSGGGFCYMVEALGLSGIAEVPLVVLMGMRPGPALGLPTWTGQEDLQFVLNAGNGEFTRFVLAPGDAQEAFDLTHKAMGLAQKYHLPAIILSDKYLSESRCCIKLTTSVFQNNVVGINPNPSLDNSGFYPRYALSENGITLRSTPGQPNGEHITNSYDHNKYGLSTEDGKERSGQVEKRFKKLEYMSQEIPPQYWETDLNPQITFISFGSTKGPLREARKTLQKEGIRSSILNLSWLAPFPKDQVKKVLESAKNPVVVEGNIQGQLAGLIAKETGIIIKNRLNRYDGRPFYPEDIVEFTKTFIEKN